MNAGEHVCVEVLVGRSLDLRFAIRKRHPRLLLAGTDCGENQAKG
jgi:hypothetical protein